jgi:hypothetical protein
VVICVVAAVAGCGAGEGPPPYQDGQRLHARQLLVEGAPSFVYGIFDRERGVHCTFMTASDGVLRCLPTTNSVAESPPGGWVSGQLVPVVAASARLGRYDVVSNDGGRFPSPTPYALHDARADRPCQASVSATSSGTEGFCLLPYALINDAEFGDPACTEPVAYYVDTGDEPPPAYVLTPDARVRAVGPELSSPPYYQDTFECRQQSLLPAVRHFRLGEFLPPDRLPKVRIAAHGSGRLMLLVVENVDDAPGAAPWPLMSMGAYYDRAAGEDCLPTWTVDAGVRCVSSTASWTMPSILFADPACSQPVVTEPASLTVMMTVPAADGAARAMGVYRVDSARLSLVYVREGDTCTGEMSKVNAYRLGELVPWTSFGELRDPPAGPSSSGP